MSSLNFRKMPRTIYALHWRDHGAVYVGQTNSTRRRWTQHRASGDWASLPPFKPMVLGTYSCTMEEGEEWEYAWRLCAQDAGLRVFGGSQFGAPYVVDPRRRATSGRRALRNKCTWPTHRVRWKLWLFLLAAAAYLFWKFI
jgi:hypothetical protein